MTTEWLVIADKWYGVCRLFMQKFFQVKLFENLPGENSLHGRLQVLRMQELWVKHDTEVLDASQKADAAEVRVQQQIAASNRLDLHMDDRPPKQTVDSSGKK